MPLPLIFGVVGALGGIGWTYRNYSSGPGDTPGDEGPTTVVVEAEPAPTSWKRIVLEAVVKGLVGGACGVLAGRATQWLLDWLGKGGPTALVWPWFT